jgi:hypothetical protein
MNAFSVLAETSSDESEVDEVDDQYSPIAVDDGALECRICQEPADLANLIAPCNCAGSVRYVHPACLSAWRSMSVANLTHCNVCSAVRRRVLLPRSRSPAAHSRQLTHSPFVRSPRRRLVHAAHSGTISCRAFLLVCENG